MLSSSLSLYQLSHATPEPPVIPTPFAPQTCLIYPDALLLVRFLITLFLQMMAPYRQPKHTLRNHEDGF